MSKIAFIYPGQGAQVCGMGQDFYEQTKEGKETFDLATDILGFSVPELCFTENDRLDITEYTQAAMVTTSIAMTKVLEAQKLTVLLKGVEDGDKVKAYVFFKGRSILFKEQGEVLLLRFANDLEDYAKVDQMPILEGKRMTIQLSPKKKEAPKKPATAGAPKPAAPAQKAEMPKTDAE